MAFHRSILTIACLCAATICSAQLGSNELAGLEMSSFPGIQPGGTQSWDVAPYTLDASALSGSTLDLHITALTLQAGSGFSPGTQAGFYRFSSNSVSTSPALSDDYIELTLTPADGYALTLEPTDSLIIYSRIYDTDSAATFVTTSADDHATFYPETNAIADTQARSYDLANINAHTGSLIVRIYVYDSDGSCGFSVRNGGSLGALNGQYDLVFHGSLAPILIFSPPTNVLAQANGETAIDLTWTDPNTGEGGFEIQVSTNAGSSWSDLVTLPANTTSYTHQPLPQSTTRWYRIRASGGGFSTYSEVVSATTDGPPPAAATNLAGAASEGVIVTLSWSDNSTTETAFVVERAVDSGPFAEIASLLPNTTSHTDRSVIPDTDYEYRVVARNGGGSASPSNIVALTTPATSHLNVLVFGNSFAHYYEYLPGLAANTGDSIHQVIIRGGGNLDTLLPAELAIAAGERQAITESEAIALGIPDCREFGWAVLETNYNAFVRVKDALDSRDWDIIAFQQGSAFANDLSLTFGQFAAVDEYFVKEGYEPSAQITYYLTTQYRNDAMVHRNAHNRNVHRAEVLRGNLPYTADLYFLDAYNIGHDLSADFAVPMIPGGIALQNLRYHSDWGIDFPDFTYDYFQSDPSEFVYVPNHRKLFFTMKSASSSGDGGMFDWVVDSHPHGYMNYLTACVWYQWLFHKDVRLNTYTPSGFDPDTCALIREVAYRTANGELPPIRLAHQADRDQYGDQLWESAQPLLLSENPGERNAGLQNLVHLYGIYPEHARAQDAYSILAVNGRLADAQALQTLEATERPIREAVYQEIWDSSSPGGDAQIPYGPDTDPAGGNTGSAIRQAMGLSRFAPVAQPFAYRLERSGADHFAVLEHPKSLLHGARWTFTLSTSSDLNDWSPEAVTGLDYTREISNPDLDGNGLREEIRHSIRLSSEPSGSFFRLQLDEK